MESPFEHLWLQIKSKSSKQSFLLGVLYQPNFDISTNEEWLQKLVGLLLKIITS